MLPTRTPDQPGLRRERPGFSILELLVTMSIFTMVVLAIYLVYETATMSYRTGSVMADLQQTARVALEQMARDIRQAGYFPTTPGSTEAIRIAATDTLSVQADVDGTGVKYITYGLRDASGNLGTRLLRQAATNLWSGGDVLATDVTVLRFTYFTNSSESIPSPLTSTYTLDGQGHVTGASVPGNSPRTDRDAIRMIKVELTLQRLVGGRAQLYTTTTEVKLRNLL